MLREPEIWAQITALARWLLDEQVFGKGEFQATAGVGFLAIRTAQFGSLGYSVSWRYVRE